MPLRLFADECVDARVVAGLRRRGVDIITASDECLLHASDEEQFARATHLGRPIVTADHDFLRLACGHWETGTPFPGIILIQPATRVGDAVHAIALLATVLNSGDMSNWVEVVPDARAGIRWPDASPPAPLKKP